MGHAHKQTSIIYHLLLSLRLSALAPLGLARYESRAPLTRRLRASALIISLLQRLDWVLSRGDESGNERRKKPERIDERDSPEDI